MNIKLKWLGPERIVCNHKGRLGNGPEIFCKKYEGRIAKHIECKSHTSSVFDKVQLKTVRICSSFIWRNLEEVAKMQKCLSSTAIQRWQGFFINASEPANFL